MNRKELVKAVTGKVELKEKDVTTVIKTLEETVVEAVANGDKVQLTGFGTFGPKERAARTGLNPQTGKKIKIAAHTVPAFKAGKAFKDAVDVKSAKKAKKK